MNDSAENGNFSSNEEVFKFDVGILNPFDEVSAHLFVVHRNLIVHGEEEQSVVSNDVGLWVVPLRLESVTRVFDGVSCHFQISYN